MHSTTEHTRASPAHNASLISVPLSCFFSGLGVSPLSSRWKKSQTVRAGHKGWLHCLIALAQECDPQQLSIFLTNRPSRSFLFACSDTIAFATLFYCKRALSCWSDSDTSEHFLLCRHWLSNFCIESIRSVKIWRPLVSERNFWSLSRNRRTVRIVHLALSQ